MKAFPVDVSNTMPPEPPLADGNFFASSSVTLLVAVPGIEIDDEIEPPNSA